MPEIYPRQQLFASRPTYQILKRSSLDTTDLAKKYHHLESGSASLSLSDHKDLIEKIKASTNLPVTFLSLTENVFLAALASSTWSYEEFSEGKCEFKYFGKLPVALESVLVGRPLGDVVEGLDFLKDEEIVSADISDHRAIFDLNPPWVEVEPSPSG
tara:strand:- start:409 stop:879 length:471 start_codon:yes stop_codon:yes gene_type:complete